MFDPAGDRGRLPSISKVYPTVHSISYSSGVTLGPSRYFAVGNLDANMPIIPLLATPDSPTSSGSYKPDKPKLADKIPVLLDQIGALDKSMDEARIEKIANTKRALANGTYHVSAAEVARKIIDDMQEP